MKPVECTSAQTVPTSATTNCKNYSRNVWRFWLEELAEKWPIILKDCSMLGDIYNAQNIPALLIWAYTLHASLKIYVSNQKWTLSKSTCSQVHVSHWRSDDMFSCTRAKCIILELGPWVDTKETVHFGLKLQRSNREMSSNNTWTWTLTGSSSIINREPQSFQLEV